MISTRGQECNHSRSTLVQHSDVLDYDKTLPADKIWFVCWQCDECGAITQQPINASHVEEGNNLPWLDVDSYRAKTSERTEGQVALVGVRFMMRAVRR